MENKTEIIDFNWCEEHGFERHVVNVAGTSYCYCLLTENKKWYQAVYTESMGNKRLSVINHKTKKGITTEMPKFDFSKEGEGIKNNFTTDDLKTMYQLVDIEYPFE